MWIYLESKKTRQERLYYRLSQILLHIGGGEMKWKKLSPLWVELIIKRRGEEMYCWGLKKLKNK